MTTSRRPSSRSNRPAASRKAEEPASITVAVPGSETALAEPKLNLERIGDILRRQREARGDDLMYIAEYLCIRPNFLIALERSQYDKLPADAYVIGFLRSYANYLGMDGKEAIDRYRNEMAGRRKKPALTLPTPITEGRTPSVMIMVGAAIAALLIYILWYGLSSGDRAAVSTPPALPSTAVAVPDNNANMLPPVTLSTEAAPPAPTPTDKGIALSAAAPAATQTGLAPALPVATTQSAAAPANANSGATGGAKATHLTIKALQSSWVLITDSQGKTIYDHVMKEGDMYAVPNTPGLSLTTGNGSGVLLTLDGVDLPKLAVGPSHVMRNISLDSDHLKALPPTPDE